MSTHEPVPPALAGRPRAGTPGLVAVAITGLQALGCAVFAVLSLLAPRDSSFSDASHLVFSALTALFAFGLGWVARGLWLGLAWPRTATVVWLVMILPVGWTMVQAGRGLVGALILGSAVVGIAAIAGESRGVTQT